MRLRVILAVLAGAALFSAVPAQGAARRTVSLGDDYFTPQTLKVKRGTTVTWRWPRFDQAGDVHDLKLLKGPSGVRRFHSEAASTDYAFKRKLTVAGTYRLGCTLHHEMQMTVKVR